MTDNNQSKIDRLERELSRLYDRLQEAQQERDRFFSAIPEEVQARLIRESVVARWEHLGDRSILVSVESNFLGSLSTASGKIHQGEQYETRNLPELIADMIEGLRLGVISDQIKKRQSNSQTERQGEEVDA